MDRIRFYNNPKASGKLASQYAALAMVDAYCALGFTVTAAIIMASSKSGFAPRTIASWRAKVAGTAIDQVNLRLWLLAPRNLKKPRVSHNAR